MPLGLEKRFFDFLASIQRSECIDEIYVNNRKNDTSRADFLLENRNVIVEVKSLETDTAYKVEEILDKHRNRPEFPIIYGKCDIQKVLDLLPDGKKINEQIFRKITKSIETGFKKANKQIAATKNTFNIPSALGLLVFLSESIEIFSPDVLMGKIDLRLNERKAEGSYRYRNIARVWVVCESHYLQIKPNLNATPLIFIEGPMSARHKEIGAFINQLQVQWATYNKIPLVSAKPRKRPID